MSTQRRIFAILGILTGLILVQACGRDLPPEESCNFVQNQNKQRVSWGESFPIDIYLDNSFPKEFEADAKAAINKWNAVGQSLRGEDFFKLRANSPGSPTPTQDSYTKIYFLNTWENTKPIEQARTTVYWTGSRIYEADIRVNNKNFQFYTGSIPDSGRVHIESLLIHEFGHVLGLSHTNSAESVMQETLANGKSRIEPGTVDISSLQCEY